MRPDIDFYVQTARAHGGGPVLELGCGTHQDGRTERLMHQYRFRYLFRFEAEHLLARAGFLTEHVFADFDRSPYGSRDPGELIFVARPA